MDDREKQIADGKEFAVKFLLLALYVEHFKALPDGAFRAQLLGDTSLSVLDTLVETMDRNEVFKHSALQEVEAFWDRVRENLSD